MGTTSGDFVNSVREIINKKKSEEYRKRSILREILGNVLEVLKRSGRAEIRSTKDFETSEISYLANLYLDSENIILDFKLILEKSGILLIENKIDDKNVVYLADLNKVIVSNSDSFCFIELKITGKYFFSLRIIPKSEPFSYRIYGENYFYLKLWLFDGSDFSNHSIQILTKNREKKKMKSNLDEAHSLNVIFDELGEIVETNISKKRGAKQNNRNIIQNR